MGECPYDAYYPYETQKKLDAANKRIAEWQTVVANEHKRLQEWREQALADRKRIVELEAEVVTLRRHVAAALTDYHDEKDRADKLEAENAKLRKDGGG